MEAEKLKETICEAIDSYRDEIVAIGEDIRIHPEPGFKEFRTAAIVAGHLDRLGIPHETNLAITGVRGLLKGKGTDITAAYFGELDSVLVRGHPDADPETGVAQAGGTAGTGHGADYVIYDPDLAYIVPAFLKSGWKVSF